MGRRELPAVGGGGFRNGHIFAIDSMMSGTMMTEERGYLMDSEAFWEGVRKVGPGSEFRYRCIFDPTPVVKGGETPQAGGRRRSERHLLIIAGPKGSGKSSLIASSELHVQEDKILNPDNFARGLANAGLGTGGRDIAEAMCRVLCGNLLECGTSFGLEANGPPDDGLDLASRAKSAGYGVELIFVTAGGPEECCRRVAERVAMGGEGASRDEVLSSYEEWTGSLQRCLGIADRAAVFDNSGDGPVLVLSKRDGVVSASEGASRCGWLGGCQLPNAVSEREGFRLIR